MSYLKLSINESFSDVLRKKLQEAGPRAAHTVAVQVAKDTEPLVPALTKSLNNLTQVVGNKVIYPGPSSQFLHGGFVMIDPLTRSPWARKGATKIVTEKPLKFNKSVHSQATDHWFNESMAQNLDKWVRVAGKAVERELK